MSDDAKPEKLDQRGRAGTLKASFSVARRKQHRSCLAEKGELAGSGVFWKLR
jgi:hypothetical protein